MYKKRWQSALMYAAGVMGNFSVVGFGLAVYQKDYDCAFIAGITFLIGFLTVLGGSDGS